MENLPAQKEQAVQGPSISNPNPLKWLSIVSFLVLVGGAVVYLARHPSELSALVPSRPATPFPSATNEVTGGFGVVPGDDIVSCKALIAEQEKLGFKAVDRDEDGAYYITGLGAAPFSSLDGVTVTYEDKALSKDYFSRVKLRKAAELRKQLNKSQL